MPSDLDRAKQWIEQSFLTPWIQQDDVTDITFNGAELYVQTSQYGREKISLILEYSEVYDWIKQLANLMNIPFNYSEPLMDISIDRYRLYAVGPSIARRGFERTISFALRIHRHLGSIPVLFLREGSVWKDVVDVCVHHRLSIVISGMTGVGKTQLQKEILQLLPAATRLIILDNILELDGLYLPHLDITMWQNRGKIGLGPLIEAALRSHPDWLLIAESRGKDFIHVLNSVMTGHPIITTLHSESIHTTDQRMVRMLRMDDPLVPVDILLHDLRSHFHVIIHLEKTNQFPLVRKIVALHVRLDDRIYCFEETMDTLHVKTLVEELTWALSS
jgi:pilus assembly protein CpaF